MMQRRGRGKREQGQGMMQRQGTETTRRRWRGEEGGEGMERWVIQR
jgi:hypothetical protein